MNEFETNYMAEAGRCGYVMLVPTNDDALRLRSEGLLSFKDAGGRFGYVRAVLTEKGKELILTNKEKK